MHLYTFHSYIMPLILLNVIFNYKHKLIFHEQATVDLTKPF